MTDNFEIARKETAALQKYAAIKASGEDTVSVSKIYIDMTDDFFAALILDELMYWTVPNKKNVTGLRVKRDGHLWLAVNRSEWWERKRIKERQADTAIQKLIELGLVEKKVMLFNAKTTLHLRIIPQKFFELYAVATQEYLAEADPDEQKEISDLYEMMGIEKGANHESVKPELQNGETYVLQNGETINNPTLNNNPLGAKTAPIILSLENQIAIGQEKIVMPTPDDTFKADCEIAVMNVCRGAVNLESLATEFITTRRIFPQKKQFSGWRKAFQTMYDAKPNRVYPQHVREAILQLTRTGMTVTDPFSIVKTAISLANPMLEEQISKLAEIAI